MSSVAAFCDWLAATPLSLLIQSVEWIIPAVQSLHILAIAVVMASVVVVDLRLLGVAGGRQTISSMTRRYFPWVWVALAVLLLTGLTLVVGEPHRELLSPVFVAKMALLAVTIVLTAAFQLSVQQRREAWDASSTTRAGARLVAVASLVLWVAIVACGRWIAYVEHG
jgi:uncharacterized membrane protein SirB2